MQSIHFFTLPIRLLRLKHGILYCLMVATLFPWACTDNETKRKDENLAPESSVADVFSVQVHGSPNTFNFSVGIHSPDQGCEQYADWWEVLSADGSLVYRRILTHSHVDEQPFVRSGGPVPIEASDIVFVRGHMHPGGYGGKVFTGSVQNGFREVIIGSDFAAEVESEPPQPKDCRF